MSYKHLSIQEHELLLIHLTQGLSLCRIANLLVTKATTCRVKLKRVTSEDVRNVVRTSCLKIRSCSRWSESCFSAVIGHPNISPLVSNSKIIQFIQVIRRYIGRFTQQCSTRRNKNVPRAIAEQGVNFATVANRADLKAMFPICCT